MNSEQPEIMSPIQVAEFLGMNPKTIYESLKKKEIPHRRVGKRYVILRAALIRWLEANG